MKFATLVKRFLEGSKVSRNLLVLILVALIGYADFITGTEMAFSVFYIIPIGLSAWYSSRNAGISIAMISALAWLVADWGAGRTYSADWLFFWNTSVRLGVFLVFSLLLSNIKYHLELEKELADQDALTGLYNRRAFFEQFDMAASRAGRYQESFTLAYIDLDNFKRINDDLGHDVGDQLLIEVARCLRKNTRSYDLTARVGGDEFVCLFPRTAWKEAKSLLKKLQRALNGIMEAGKWPVTFSIGALSFDRPVGNSQEMLRLVDALMYTVKKSTKNAVVHKHWFEVERSSSLLDMETS
jgi:diguanylate cyclase (GGDEF)-like protein